MVRRVVVAALSLALVAMVVLAARGWWVRTHRSGLEQAVRVTPASTKRLNFTDWAAVRKRVGVTGTSSAQVQKLVEKSYDLDLSAASSIDESAVALQAKLGFSPANAQWESYEQSSQGAAMLLRMPDDVDFSALAEKLQSAGFPKPAKSDGVWNGGPDLVASLDPTITPELQYVVLLRDQHLVVSSDTASYAASVARGAAGHQDTLDSVPGVDAMASRVGSPAAAMMWTRDFACSDLAMSHAATDAQAASDRLVAAAGKVTPLTGLTMALAPDRTLTLAEQFQDSQSARDNLRARARLVVGQDPARSGTFSDLWTLRGDPRTSGSTVLLRLRPKRSTGFVLSNVYSGPELFATC